MHAFRVHILIFSFMVSLRDINDPTSVKASSQATTVPINACKLPTGIIVSHMGNI